MRPIVLPLVLVALLALSALAQPPSSSITSDEDVAVSAGASARLAARFVPAFDGPVAFRVASDLVGAVMPAEANASAGEPIGLAVTLDTRGAAPGDHLVTLSFEAADGRGEVATQAELIGLVNEGGLSQREIGERLGITQQAVSQQLQELARRGLLPPTR